MRSCRSQGVGGEKIYKVEGKLKHYTATYMANLANQGINHKYQWGVVQVDENHYHQKGRIYCGKLIFGNQMSN